jgi:hypothetical protein
MVGMRSAGFVKESFKFGRFVFGGEKRCNATASYFRENWP